MLVDARLDEDVGARLLLLAITLLDPISAPLGRLELLLAFIETNDFYVILFRLNVKISSKTNSLGTINSKIYARCGLILMQIKRSVSSLYPY